MSNYQPGQSLTSYGQNYGGNYGHGPSSYVQQPTLAPSKSSLWRTSTKAAKVSSKVPENYYNYHNSLYESSTVHNDADDEEAYYYDDVIVDSNKKNSRPVAPRPNKLDEASYPNYDVMTHFGDEETSTYPDYPAPGEFFRELAMHHNLPTHLTLLRNFSKRRFRKLS